MSQPTGSSSSGLTGMLPQVDKIGQEFDRLQAENVELKTRAAEQLEAMGKAKAAFDEQHTALEDALRREEEANARAAKLAALVDAAAAGQSVERPRELGEHLTGDLVTYRFRDVVTGDQLTGPGVVVRPGEGALVVAPVSALFLQLPTDAVSAAPVGVLTGEHEPAEDEDEDA